jgi:hypothetical protein
MTHPPLAGPRLHRNRVGRPRSRQTTAKVAGIEPPLCGNHPATTPATSTATMTQHFQDSKSPTAPPLHHRAVAAASTNRRRVRVVSRLSATGRRLGSITREPRQQPAGTRAEAAPGPRRHHVETHPRARAEGHAGGAERAWHRPADPPASVEGTSLGLTAPWLLAADRGRPLPPSSHPTAAWRQLIDRRQPCRGQSRLAARG